MSDVRSYPKGNSRQIMDFNRFLSLTGNKIFLCLDKGILEVCKYLLNSRGGWKTSYAVQWDNFSYTLPTDEQFEILINAIGEANLDMASCDDIVEALQGIQGAIQENGGSGGSGGCGCVGEGGTDVTDLNDSPSSDIPPSGDWASLGFASEEAYDTHKCDAAQYILENYIQTLRNWAGLFGMVGGLTLAVITGLLLLTVPPVGLMVILGAMGLIVGTDIGLLINLSSIADDLEADIDNLRCLLYNATTTEEAADVIRDAASAAVVSLTLGALEGTFITITDNLISNDAIGALFDPAGPTVDTPADCTGCATCVPLTAGVTIDIGSGSHIGAGIWEVSGVFQSGWACGAAAREVAIYNIPDGFLLQGYTVTSGTITACGGDPYHAFEGLGSPYSGTEGTSASGFAVPLALGSLYILSATDFTIQFELCQL